MTVRGNPVEGTGIAALRARRVDNALCLLTADWLVNAALPSMQEVSRGIAQTPNRTPYASTRPNWVVGTVAC